MSETLINGYHLFAIRCQASESSEDISFTEFENEMGDGWYSQRLYGSWNGFRSWQLKFPTLSKGGSVVLGDVTYNYADYLWELYCESQTSGRPFVIQSPRNDQYYLARFDQQGLSYDRMLTALYSSGVTFKQIRLDTVSVFDTTKLSSGQIHQYNETGHADPIWHDALGALDISASGDVVFGANPRNGLNTVAINTVSPSGGLLVAEAIPMAEIMLVFKVPADTFADDAFVFGPLTSGGQPPALLGNGGGDTMDNAMPVAYKSEKAQAVLTGPMNEFKVIWLSGFGTTFQDTYGSPNIVGWQAGIDFLNFSEPKLASFYLAEMILAETPFIRSEGRELFEHLAMKWSAK